MISTPYFIICCYNISFCHISNKYIKNNLLSDSYRLHWGSKGRSEVKWIHPQVFGYTPLVPVFIDTELHAHLLNVCASVNPPKGKLGTHNQKTKTYITRLGGSLVLREPILLQKNRLCVPCTQRSGCPANVSLGKIQNPFSTRISLLG